MEVETCSISWRGNVAHSIRIEHLTNNLVQILYWNRRFNFKVKITFLPFELFVEVRANNQVI